MGCISLFKKFGILILAFLIIVSCTAIPIFAADQNAEAVASEQFDNRVKAFKGAEVQECILKAPELHWITVKI